MSDVRLGGHHRRGMIHGRAFAITLAAGVILTLAVSASAHGDQWPDSPPPQSVAALQTTVDSQAHTIRSMRRVLTRERRTVVVMRTRPGCSRSRKRGESERWLEVNECMFLFDGAQVWKRGDARDFAYAAWNYLGYTSS